MKKTIFLLIALIALTTGCKKDNDNNSANTALLRHVVLFKFKDSSTQEDIKKIEDAFRALPAQIIEIKDFEWGTNNSPEGLSEGFTHCFLVTFSSEKDRDNYLPHPAHRAFVNMATPHIEKALVIDFWAKE
jgi:hypothetical protein